MEHLSTVCACQVQHPEKKEQQLFKGAGKAGRTISSTLTSVLIAFFPKCPICWAVYMSTFGSLGLAKLQYLPWLMPVLITLMIIHLLLLLRNIRQKGYLPFLVSFAGAALIIIERIFFTNKDWPLELGIALVFSGSLLNTLLNIHPRKQSLEAHN